MPSNFTRRDLFRRTAGLGVASLYSAYAQPSRPNVLIILADDQGWGDLGANGNTNLSTPNIDSLARDGATAERFYACAVCAPTRAEFLTGRYHARGGVHGVSTGAERLNLDETTIAQSFKAAGYATGAFGKWHNGSQFPYHPKARGFDEFYGFTSGHWGQYFDTEMDHNGELVRGKGFIADDLANHAIDFIAQHKDRPFFCYLPFNTPHSPMQVPDRFFEKFANLEPKLRAKDPAAESVPNTRAALAMCENLDWNVGRVLKHLEDLKLAANTIVVYFSDNGPADFRWNGGMKGKKATVDEGGLRVPFFLRWPGHVRPGMRIPQIAGAIDLFPTLADLAGVPVTSRKPLDGVSLKPLLLGNAEWPARRIFSLQNNQVSVRTQQYRLDNAGRLFDMQADPGQEKNIAAAQPEVAATLRQAVADWRKEVLPTAPDDRPFTVGYAKTTLLPARDGVPAGGVTRSSIHPNSSFFTTWTTQEGRMTWDIEVAQTADFDAQIYYTCPAADTGSTVELSFNGASAKTRIAQPNDPPLTGAAFDRVPRIESYVKDFRPVSAGVIRLAKGRGKLTLRALEIPGKQVADVRYVVLTLRS